MRIRVIRHLSAAFSPPMRGPGGRSTARLSYVLFRLTAAHYLPRTDSVVGLLRKEVIHVSLSLVRGIVAGLDHLERELGRSLTTAHRGLTMEGPWANARGPSVVSGSSAL